MLRKPNILTFFYNKKTEKCPFYTSFFLTQRRILTFFFTKFWIFFFWKSLLIIIYYSFVGTYTLREEEVTIFSKSCPTRTSVFALAITCALLLITYICTVFFFLMRRWLNPDKSVWFIIDNHFSSLHQQTNQQKLSFWDFFYFFFYVSALVNCHYLF